MIFFLLNKTRNMRVTVWRTFISNLLEALSDQSMSSAEGDGDNELVVMVEIKLADVTLRQ